MFGLIVSAVRARTAQVLTLLVLTTLAAAVAAAGPWYGIAAADRAAAAHVAAAPAAQRTLSVRQQAETEGDPRGALDIFAGAARSVLPIRDGSPTLGATQAMSVTRNDVRIRIPVAFRDEFCRHVRLTGSCPAAAGEAALSRSAAQQLGLEVGDPLVVQSAPGTPEVTLRVTARYEIADPYSAYWSNPLFLADAGLEPAFTPLDTFTDEQLTQPTLVYDIDVPDAALRGDRDFFRFAELLRTADTEFSRRQIRLVNPTGPLLRTIDRDRATIERGVLVPLVQVLVLSWFAIGLAGRYTGRDRRGDAALLELRGSGRTGVLRLTLGQHLVPLAGGVLIGAPLGVLAARALAGPIISAGSVSWVLSQTAVAVGAVLAGGLLVLAAVEAAVLRLPVAELLRRVPSGRRDWRADVIDLVLLVVAVAGVYQAQTGGPAGGLALAGPALVALAVALLLARLLSRLADRAGAVALRTGRLRFGLTAVQVSRQPGTDRVFALVVVAVAGFATAAGGWAGLRTANQERGEVELGAARVLTVQASSRTALMHAVRQADPVGRTAMAVVIDQVARPPILAVDAERLAAVARWRPEYGPVGALGDALAAVPVPAPLPAITGGRLVLRAANDTPVPLLITAVLQNQTSGATVPVTFGPLPRGAGTARAAVSGCAPGCRFVRWELSTPRSGGQAGPPPDTGTVSVQALDQEVPAAAILGPAQLGDIARWRSDIAGLALDLAARDGRLAMSMEPNVLSLGSTGRQVSAVDAALPVPLILVGEAPGGWKFTDPTVAALGGDVTPVRVAGTAAALPALGTSGMLIDLGATARLVDDSDLAGTYQVWLAADAPARVIAALTANGLTVTADVSAAARADQLAGQGPSVVARFALLAAVAALLLAAATVAVAAAVDRGDQLAQARALRLQGLPVGAARAAGWGGTAAVLVAGVLAGVGAAALAQPFARVSLIPFTDGWQVIPLPDPLGAAALTVAAVVAAALLALIGWLSVRPLIRRLGRPDDHRGDR